ncbi:VOC family protein [Kribbella sp. NBC_01505]|uniref:VOC family protein n=1 Tax=Kribbella sp. NBC_01505 TaxID=2903580 RepID=UPI003863B3A8
MESFDDEAVRFRWNAVCIDCAPEHYDAEVAFYRDLLGTEVAERESRWAALRDPQSGMWLNIQANDWYLPPVWPEDVPAQTKMMHFEIRVNDVQAAVTRAVSFGAREAPQQPADRDLRRLRVMLDPAGHPFCLWS